MAAAESFKGLIEPVARELLGEPNRALSHNGEIRFGAHGSLSIDIEHDRFFDHEAKEGGGVLDLVARETGARTNGEASEWLRDHGYLEAERRERRGKAPKRKVEAVYYYDDEGGTLLFQTVRFTLLDESGQPVVTDDGKIAKTFSQRRPPRPEDPPDKVKDGWVWSVKGVRLVPYKLPELLEAIAEGRPYFIVEGEKKVDALAERGVPATCAPMGAGKWPESFGPLLRGSDAVLLPDNDEAGRKHMAAVAANLAANASTVRVLDLPGLREKGDVVDWLGAGHTVDELFALVEERAKPWDEAAAYETKFRAVWAREIDKVAPAREWIVKGVFPAKGFALIYGDPKCGKSFLTLDLTLTAAKAAFDRADGTWFGRRIKPAGVIYIGAEGQDDLRLRMQAWFRKHELKPGTDLPFVLLPTSIDLRSTERVDDLIAEVKAHARMMRVPRLIVGVDTVARTFGGGEEISSVDMGQFVENCTRIGEAVAGLVVGVHHKPSGGNKPRGHTSLLAAVDVAVDVTKPADGGDKSWTVKDSKVGREGLGHTFKLDIETLAYDEDEDAITTCVVVPTDGVPREQGEKGPRRSDSQEIALQALRNALVDFGEAPNPALQLPKGVRVVNSRHWKAEYLKMAFDEEPTAEAFRQEISRVGKALVARGLIGRALPYLWIAKKSAE